MCDKGDSKETNDKKKGFIASMMEKLDKKLEKKSKQNGCCCSGKDKGGSCC